MPAGCDAHRRPAAPHPRHALEVNRLALERLLQRLVQLEPPAAALPPSQPPPHTGTHRGLGQLLLLDVCPHALGDLRTLQCPAPARARTSLRDMCVAPRNAASAGLSCSAADHADLRPVPPGTLTFLLFFSAHLPPPRVRPLGAPSCPHHAHSCTCLSQTSSSTSSTGTSLATSASATS